MPTLRSRSLPFVPLLLGGAAIGATLMYLFDPVRGRKRRARLAGAVTHAQRVERELIGKGLRDARHRARGVAQRALHAFGSHADVDNEVVAARIRACLGRVVSHPHAVSVVVVSDQVIVSGEILAHEASRTLDSISAIAGKREVVDQLERHAIAGSRPALQGEGRVRRGAQTWTPAARVGAMAAGAALIGVGVARKGVPGLVAGLAGVAIAARGMTNRPLGRGEIRISKTIQVRAPVERVFELWNRFDEFPKFMSHVRNVRVEGDRSFWEVDGPPGMPLHFEAEITLRQPNRAIGWRTLPRQAVDHVGLVRFERSGELTRVHVQMLYRPPAGMLGHAIARLLGWDPKHRMDDDLMRMKSLLEDGHTRADRRRVDVKQLISTE
jgi:uncharacterized membrane protein